MTRVKICGITSLRDAEVAIECGADALGFVLEPSSPRHIADVSFVEELVAKLPPYVYTVAVFGPPPSFPPPAGVHAIQCEGTIEPFDLGSTKRIQVVRLSADLSEEDVCSAMHASDTVPADALLVDAYDSSAYGGTGKTANWDEAAALRRRLSPLPLILAGGLTPENVGEAIMKVRPYAVDVGSGVESEPRFKDAGKLRRFFDAVREADSRSRS